MGFTYRKYQVNENYFKIWTPDMTWVFGLILTDGSVQDSTHRKGPVLRLASIDIDLLETVRTLMNSNHIIRQESNKNGTWYVLSIYSAEIVHDLMNLGIVPRKSLTVTMPPVPEEFMRNFILSVFDGDGSVYEIKRKDANTPGIELEFATGSLVFRSQLADFLNEKVRTTTHYRFSERTNNTGVGTIRTNNKGAEDLYRYMYYSDDCPRLRRKFDKFTELMERRKDIIYNYKS